MSLNVVILQGNLVADPEVFGEENNVARFTIAVNGGYGEHKRVSFIDCVAFGKQVEAITKFLTKGKQILVEGELQQNKWETNEGEKRSKLEVRVTKFHFVSNGSQRSEEDNVEATTGDDGKLF